MKRSLLTYRLAVASFFFTHGTVFSAWANRIPDIKKMLNLDDAQWGSMLFALPLGQFTMMWISGLLVTRFGSRNMSRIATLIYPLILISISYSNSPTFVFFQLMLFGMFANINNISVNTQAVGVERLYGRSIMSSFHGIWSMSGFCGGIISGVLVANSISATEQFVGVTIFAYLMVLFVSRYMMESDIKPQQDASKKSVRGFFRPTPLVILCGFIAFGSMSCEGIMFDWSVIYFQDIVKTPLDLTHIGYIAFMLTMAGGRLLGDLVITRFGAMKVLLFNGFIIFSGMMTAVIFPTIIASTIGFLLVGMGVSVVVPTCFSLAGRSRRMSPSIAIATVSTIGFLGFLIGPPLIGYLAEAFTLRLSFAVMAFVGLLVSLLSHSAPLKAAQTGVYTDSIEVEKELCKSSK